MKLHKEVEFRPGAVAFIEHGCVAAVLHDITKGVGVHAFFELFEFVECFIHERECVCG